MVTTTKRVVVIGAGPAGLTTLKTLLHFPRSLSPGEPAFDPILLEAASSIGGTFDQRSYENGCLVSSKQLTSFSDYRFPADAGDHPTMGDYVDYLGRYVNRFGLDSKAGEGWEGTPMEGRSRIQLGCRVEKVERAEGGGHDVTYSSFTGTHTIHADALSVCTGLHVTPAVPAIPGLPSLLSAQSPPVLTAAGIPNRPPGGGDWEEKEGVRVIHSSQYKKREEFAGRKVLILGIGETSMDLSYEAIKAGAKEVVVCHRGGFLSFPKVLNDFQIFGVKFDGELPIDGLITNLFETAYVHPWVAGAHVRWFVSDFVIKRVLWFLTGTQAGCNQWVGSLPPERLGRAYVFLNKSSKAMPYINRPYKPSFRILSSLLGTSYIDPPLDAASTKSIDLALWPSHVDASGRVHFMKSCELPQGGGMRRIEEERMRDREVRPDLVVFATGYKQEWGWLGKGYPRGPSEVDVREVCDSTDVSLGFIGFVRPGVGAIPPIAEQQAMLWALLLLDKVPLPTSVPHYRLLASKTARIQYGVDHSSYMSTLAKDMGAAPGLWELYSEHGIHVLATYCFGAAFVSLYRLSGPYASKEMDEIVKTEIWETITRRGVIGNLFMGLIPMLFYGVLNAMAWVAETVWIAVGRPGVGVGEGKMGKME